jgi:hypothetical protein
MLTHQEAVMVRRRSSSFVAILVAACGSTEPSIDSPAFNVKVAFVSGTFTVPHSSLPGAPL